MYLRWDYLFWGIFIFAWLMFGPMVEALGRDRSTAIIIVGLGAIVCVKVIEYRIHADKMNADKMDEDSDD